MNEEEYERELQLYWEHAPANPGMFGVGTTGHIWNIHDIPRLVWERRIFRTPKQVTIHLSPHQYLIFAQTGSIIRHLQKALTWKDKYCLTQGWDKEYQQYVKKPESCGRWGRFWESATGPRFHPFQIPPMFSHRFVLGIRAGRALWCQEFDGGRPVAHSYALKESQSVGVLVGAYLNSDWYTGLPFTPENIPMILRDHRETSYWRENKTTGKEDYVHRYRDGTFQNTSVVWHEADELITQTTTAKDLLEWGG